MIEIVPPLYLAIACLFLGVTIAGWPALDARLLPGERANWLGVVGGLAAALASVCIAIAPRLGPWLLPLSTITVWVAFLATTLRVRSWGQTVSSGFMRWSFVVLAILSVATVLQAMLVSHRPYRIYWQCLLSWGLLSWMFVELTVLMRKSASLQLSLMRWSTVGLAGVVGFWSWVLLFSEKRTELLVFSTLFSEAALAFSMRLFLVALLVLLLIAANGYAMERMVNLKAQVSQEKQEVQLLNAQLQQVLQEKNEMLRALSLSSRSKNLPVIMSSLSHEINQPLGAIRLNADFLIAEDADLPADKRHAVLQQLASASTQATQVINDFRRFLEVHQPPHVPVDLSVLLTDVQRALHAEATRHQVKLSVTMPAGLVVTADPVQMESAMTGVILQMIRRCDGPWRQLRVLSERQAGFVQVCVVDDGPMLTRALFDQAFVRPQVEGQGGISGELWLCRAIVEHHGGTLSRQERIGMSGICIRLPLAEDQ